MPKLKTLFTLAACTVVVGCAPIASASAASAHTDAAVTHVYRPGGTLIYNENFSGHSLDSGWASSWFNGGSAEGVRTSPSNVSVKGGDLILKMSSSSVGSTADTDPRQAPNGRGFTFDAGTTVEADMYIPGRGDQAPNWPGFWTTSDSWPNEGEVDIVEGLGDLTTNYHSPSGAHNKGAPSGNWTGWHTFALNREHGKNLIYWDGRLVRSYRTDDNGGPEYLVFNISSGSRTVTGAGSEMKIAWVKAWRDR